MYVQFKVHIFLQSAKTNHNVEEVFFSIARDIKQRLSETENKSEVNMEILFGMILRCDSFSQVPCWWSAFVLSQ